jgi:hypothetical protein
MDWEFSMSEIKNRLIEQVETHNIYLVNGDAIRKIEPDFTNFAESHQFPKLFPEIGFHSHDFLIDYDEDADLRRRDIHHMLLEWHLTENGMSYAKAVDKVDSMMIHEDRREKNGGKHIMMPSAAYIRPFGVFKNGVVAMWASEKFVRTHFEESWTMGGNWMADPGFVDDFHIIISDSLIPDMKEALITLGHEYNEAELMPDTKRTSYIKAHDKTLRQVDEFARHHWTAYKDQLDKWGWKAARE